ncbi:MAG: hypothetical protein QM776_05180 [Rhodocyclaceae bacterium]
MDEHKKAVLKILAAEFLNKPIDELLSRGQQVFTCPQSNPRSASRPERTMT